jgi:hypothetical protein
MRQDCGVDALYLLRLLAFLQTQSVRYFTEHGVGFHPAALGSFLKSVVLVKGRLK